MASSPRQPVRDLRRRIQGLDPAVEVGGDHALRDRPKRDLRAIALGEELRLEVFAGAEHPARHGGAEEHQQHRRQHQRDLEDGLRSPRRLAQRAGEGLLERREAPVHVIDVNEDRAELLQPCFAGADAGMQFGRLRR